MIDLKDLNRAVCDLYRQALKAAGNAAEILPGAGGGGCPLPHRAPQRQGGAGAWHTGTAIAFRTGENSHLPALFFRRRPLPPEDGESGGAARPVGAAFLDGITVGDTYLGIDEGVSFTVTDGVLVAAIDLRWSEDIPEQEGEPMENLIYNEEGNI